MRIRAMFYTFRISEILYLAKKKNLILLSSLYSLSQVMVSPPTQFLKLKPEDIPLLSFFVSYI